MEPINPFDHNRFIGYVSLVSPDITKIHFPNSPLLKKFYHSGEVLHSGIVGNYVVIEGEGYGFLGKIVSISLPEKERMFLSESSFQNTDLHPVGTVEILLAFDIFKYEFEKGLDQFPPVGAKVYACSTDFLQQFLKNFGKRKDVITDDLLPLASLTNDKSGAIKVSANALFGRHCAVVGTTGGGKSYTLSKLISEMTKKDGTKIILIDATGEFNTFVGANVMHAIFNSIESDATYLHYSKLKEDDLYALFRPAGQVQLPKLHEAMRSLKFIYQASEKADTTSDLAKCITPLGDQGISVLKKGGKPRTIFMKLAKELHSDSLLACCFDIKSLPYQIYSECVYESDKDHPERYGGASERDRGNCESLITRISSTLQTEHFDAVFSFSKLPSAIDNQELSSKITSFFADESKKLLRIDLGNVPDEQKVREILVNAIGRSLLDKARNKEFIKKPVLVFVDEAHQFLNKKIKDEYSIEIELNAFERIAKECRKYGLFICISTQRPRDIPEGILSQMGTFVAHRLINNFDREAVAKASSEATKYALSFLPILGRGEALLMGVDFPMPMIVRIQESSVIPDSHTPLLFEKHDTKTNL